MKVDGFEITEWTAGDGSPILYPKTMTGQEKSQGGYRIDAPVSGTPPTTGLWQRTNLAKNGLVRLLRSSSHGEIEITEFQKFTERKIFEADAQFPWTHIVESTIAFRSSPDILLHHLCISRPEVSAGARPEEAGEDLMPLSFGLHPYFATHGEPFQVKYGSAVVADETTGLEASLLKCTALGVTLETVRGTVVITPTGYDQWRVSTDDSSKYICIKPTRGRLDELLLKPRGRVDARCEVKYFPKT